MCETDFLCGTTNNICGTTNNNSLVPQNFINKIGQSTQYILQENGKSQINTIVNSLKEVLENLPDTLDPLKKEQ